MGSCGQNVNHDNRKLKGPLTDLWELSAAFNDVKRMMANFCRPWEVDNDG